MEISIGKGHKSRWIEMEKKLRKKELSALSKLISVMEESSELYSTVEEFNGSFKEKVDEVVKNNTETLSRIKCIRHHLIIYN